VQAAKEAEAMFFESEHMPNNAPNEKSECLDKEYVNTACKNCNMDNNKAHDNALGHRDPLFPDEEHGRVVHQVSSLHTVKT